MSEITQSVIIKAPASKVFEFVTNPANWPRYVTNLLDVKDMSPDIPSRGSTFTYQYKIMGFKVEGRGMVAENVRDKRFVLSFESAVPIKESYDFVERGDGTMEFFFNLQYEVPGQILAVANKLLIEKLNTIEAKNILEKIKTECEWS